MIPLSSSSGFLLGSVEVTSGTSPKRLHTTHELISITRESVESSILLIRSQRVILDRVLAGFYGVTTKVLNEAVKRNPEQFPPDFVFQLTVDETKAFAATRSRLHTYAFTEHGIMMFPSILRSERTIQANIKIMRTFAQLREIDASNAEFSRRLDVLERKYARHDEILSDAIRELSDVPEQRPIGFIAKR